MIRSNQRRLNVVFFALLFGLAFSASIAAQTATLKDGPPDVEVVKIIWRRIEHRRNLDQWHPRTPPQNPDRGPNEVANIVVRPLYSEIEPWSGYVCEFTVRNNGAKIVRKLVWDYVFIDPATKKRIGYRQYKSKVKILPGTTAKLVARVGRPPIAVVDVNQINTNSPAQTNAGSDKPGTLSQSNEETTIERIEYKDGTVWKRHN
jgi:hypothetical protein